MKKTTQGTSIEQTLKERGSRYGSFDKHAEVTQELKRVMHVHKGWNGLSDDKRECLDMIAHKVGRILCGDPEYIDSFRDISGYATLVVKNLEVTEGATDSVTHVVELKNGTWNKI